MESNATVKNLIDGVGTVVLIDSVTLRVNNANEIPVEHVLTCEGLYAYARIGGALYVYDPLNEFYTQLRNIGSKVEIEDWRDV